MPAYTIFNNESGTNEVNCNEPGCEDFFVGGFEPGAEDEALEIHVDSHNSWHGFDEDDDNGLTDDLIEEPDPCPDCGGTGMVGFLRLRRCKSCDGDGYA